jgi:hypothetical protein
MPDPSIVTQLPLWTFAPEAQKTAEKPPDLHTLWQWPAYLPACVTSSLTIMRNLELLSPLHWAHFPERNLQRNWGQPAIPYAALVAAELVRLNEALPTMGKLRRFLSEHPGFIWLFGFPLQLTPETPLGFNPLASLPSSRHLTDMLRTLPNAALQVLLADSVALILAELNHPHHQTVDCISLDTKHIVAWVKENNPKASVPHRFDKTRQPRGDPDCRLGCKRTHNQVLAPQTPQRYPVVPTLQVGEYYWGYASGVVVTSMPPWGEFVLAEWTQPFDQGDVTYFFPLMAQVEQRLGDKPRYGTFDAAFDAWYVYAYFHRGNDPLGGFAAVPFSERGGYTAHGRHFDPTGLPLCRAGLPMPLRLTFTDRTTCLVEHERGQYGCPLHFPVHTARPCPVHHARARRGGCTAMMPTSIGARLRYTLDRESHTYQRIYAQRTAVERINAQAVALGIERPHLRNGRAIVNQTTLIYLLINLRFLQRLRQSSLSVN